MRRWSAKATSSCLRSASTADCMSGYWSLQARRSPPFAVARWTCPSEAAAAGFRSKLPNRACQSGAQLGLHPPPDEGRAHGRRIGLELLQFGGVFGRQQIRHGGQQLRHLHDRALQAAQRLRQGGRIGGTFLARTGGTWPCGRRRRRHWRPRWHSARRGRRSGWLRDRSRPSLDLLVCCRTQICPARPDTRGVGPCAAGLGPARRPGSGGADRTADGATPSRRKSARGPSGLSFHPLQLGDHALDHAEADLPEARIRGVEAEGRQQFAVWCFVPPADSRAR